ncbi:MAG: sensor domain-containing diguanylate cyclase [Planctomycetes bacterium]|nr:sensor domain-containing diguanylate cyclase [Planctomycetota bacterium]
MRDASLVYIGSDNSFARALSDIASAHNIPCRVATTNQIPDISIHKANALLVIIDASSPISKSHLKRLGTLAARSMLVLAIDSSQQISDDKSFVGPDDVDDLLVKQQGKHLDKKIDFYLKHLQGPSSPDAHDLIDADDPQAPDDSQDNPASKKIHDPIDIHVSSKKQRSQTQLIIHLQEQLSQFNKDLQAQEEVINKIHQITHFSRQINCLNLNQLAMVCNEKIPSLINARFYSIYTYDQKHNTLHLLRHNHPYTIDEEIDISKRSDSPMAIAIREKRMLLIKDFNRWSHAEDLQIDRPFGRNYQSNSCIIAPLCSGRIISGLMNLADKTDGGTFDSAKDLPPVELLCEIIGSAMANIKLYEKVHHQARTDGMTGLINHNTFYNELDKEVTRSRRYGGNLSLIMIDLDNLKQINDQYGHRAGDAVLLDVTRHIVYCIRETDIAARYGGDEFAIILPNTSLSDALIVAQRLLEMVSENPITIDNQRINASISIGLGQFQTHNTTEDFMRESDTALLEAKSTGKNRIQISDPVHSTDSSQFDMP